MRKPTFGITGRKNLSAICVSVILGLCIGAGCHWYASSRPDMTRVGKVDSLNTKACLVRYVHPAVRYCLPGRQPVWHGITQTDEVRP